MKKLLMLFIIIFLTGCSNRKIDYSKGKDMLTDLSDNIKSINKLINNKSLINESGNTIMERINVPEGFHRIQAEEGSFAYYLRNLPLKPHGSKVKYYNGRIKSNDVYEAVVDMDIGSRDLQQCADSIMRLRAEYLYSKKQYDKIHFNFTNGFRADYSKWVQGNRIVVEGNKAYYRGGVKASDDYDSFRKYLDMVFTYAGTLSLSKELKQINIKDMKIGDVFIQGGSPGHCVIVVDMAENINTGEKLFLLVQGYMPAQEMHILKNPKDKSLSPWYSLNFEEELITPEWIFKISDIKRFQE